MKTNKLTILFTCAAVALLANVCFPTTCAASGPKAEAAQPAAVYTAQETAEFQKLTKETLVSLNANKNPEMIAKLTDLETAWDAKEEILKPKDPATWTLLDKTLDKAISALRSSKVDLSKGKAALEDLLEKLKAATQS